MSVVFPFRSPAANHVGLITTRREWSIVHVLLPHLLLFLLLFLCLFLLLLLLLPALPAPLCFIRAKQPETIQAATAAPQLDNATPHQLRLPSPLSRLPSSFTPPASLLCGRLNDASPVSALHEAEAIVLLPPVQPLPTGF